MKNTLRFILFLLTLISFTSKSDIIDKKFIALFIGKFHSLDALSEKNLKNSLYSINAHPEAVQDEDSFEIYTSLVFTQLGDDLVNNTSLSPQTTKSIETCSVWKKSLIELFPEESD